MKQPYRVIRALLVTIILTACGQQALPTPLEPSAATSISIPPSQTPVTTQAPPTSTITSAASPTEIAASGGVSFANDILPIFKNSCNKCHGDEETKKGLDMRTYESLMAGSFGGSVVTPGNANDSFLVHQIINGQMPKRARPLTSDEIHLIIDWVNQGALNN
jgi:Planctomycete cytochrome C